MDMIDLYIVSGLTLCALSYLVVCVATGAVLSIRPFTVVRRSESPSEFWTLIGINAVSVILLVIGVYNLVTELLLR